MDMNQISGEFVQFYYENFDNKNFDALETVYRDDSMLSMQDTDKIGVAPILEQLKSLPFQNLQHKSESLVVKVQPSEANLILVLVAGQLGDYVDYNPNDPTTEPHLLFFTQCFTLKPVYTSPENPQYYVLNEIFHLLQ